MLTKTKVATKERADLRPRPPTPWPLAQREPSTVPTPTSSAANKQTHQKTQRQARSALLSVLAGDSDGNADSGHLPQQCEQ